MDLTLSESGLCSKYLLKKVLKVLKSDCTADLKNESAATEGGADLVAMQCEAVGKETPTPTGTD